jgi:hypothetical protein
MLILILTIVQAQTNTTNNNNRSRANQRARQTVDSAAKQVQPSAVPPPVTGSGTGGQITRWAGSNVTSSTIVDSGITEDKIGNIGIGATLPTSKLTVAGMIQITLGGLKFPYGTIQTSGAGSLFSVTHDTTLKGTGTGASPLGVTVPLSLSGSLAADGLVNILNTGLAGTGVIGTGGDTNLDGEIAGFGVRGFGGKTNAEGQSGAGVTGTGGDANPSAFSRGGDGVLGRGGKINGPGFSGVGVVALGGTSTTTTGGASQGLLAAGGFGEVSSGGIGVSATGGGGNGVGNAGGDGIVAKGGSGDGGAGTGRAGVFNGDVQVTGNLSKGGGSFKIDHPLDPENKYLYHSFVESPDMMNIYNGNAKLDSNGEATVELPEWFGVLNKDFRYSLTALGAPGPNLYIAEEVAENHFKIAGGTPGAKVSWTLTGIRQDAWANAHRIKVEEEKTERERGLFLYPELFNQPEEKSVEWARHPDLMKRMKQDREQMKQK